MTELPIAIIHFLSIAGNPNERLLRVGLGRMHERGLNGFSHRRCHGKKDENGDGPSIDIILRTRAATWFHGISHFLRFAGQGLIAHGAIPVKA